MFVFPCMFTKDINFIEIISDFIESLVKSI